MLEFLRGRASDRKLILFSVACLRHKTVYPREPELRNFVVYCEREADGFAGLDEHRRLFRQLFSAGADWGVVASPTEPWELAQGWAVAAAHNEQWNVPKSLRRIFGART